MLGKGTKSKSVIIKDVMRSFHGDATAAQLGAGQQKGGHYFCPTCGIHASNCNDIEHSCEHLSVDFLKKELNSRNLSSEGNKTTLSLRSQHEMEGMIRLPALCYYDLTGNIQNLQNYEIVKV